MVLRCAEERRLGLDDTVGSIGVATVEPDASVRQLLTHTSGAPDNLTFSLRPERLAPLWPIVRACADDSYRETFATLLHRLAMFDSVPGPDMLTIAPPAEGIPHPTDVERYAAILQRRAIPYFVADDRRALQSSYPEATARLAPATGLVTTVRDLAKFDLALKQGLLLEAGDAGRRLERAERERRGACRTAWAGSCSTTTAKKWCGSSAWPRTHLRR